MGRGGQTATRQKSLVKHVPVHVMRMHTSEMTKETTRVVLENEEIGPRTKMEAGLDDGDGIANGSNAGICERCVAAQMLCRVAGPGDRDTCAVDCSVAGRRFSWMGDDLVSCESHATV